MIELSDLQLNPCGVHNFRFDQYIKTNRLHLSRYVASSAILAHDTSLAYNYSIFMLISVSTIFNAELGQGYTYSNRQSKATLTLRRIVDL